MKKWLSLVLMVICMIENNVECISWMNPKLAIKQSKTNDYGIFTIQPITKNERLIVFGGTIMTEEQILNLSKNQITYALQIDDDLWIHSNKDDKTAAEADYLNHSCNPNAGFKNIITLIAMRNIAIDEEITIDFAMVVERFIGMNDFPCHCNSSSCRKMVKGTDWQLKELQQKYYGYFSPYLQLKIDQLTIPR